jgi:hypothetical protein
MFEVYDMFRINMYAYESSHFILPTSERLIDSGISNEDERILRALRAPIKAIVRLSESHSKYLAMGRAMELELIPKIEELIKEVMKKRS